MTLLCKQKFGFFLYVVCAKLLPSCPNLCNPMDIACQLLCLWDSPGKNTGVGCHVPLQGIFPTQGLNPSLHVSCIGRQVPYHYCHLICGTCG